MGNARLDYKDGHEATAASLAGANATASMAGAPWPVDMGAPAFGSSMMGAALAFEMGGIVPGVTRGDSVPAMLTPGEAVLPKRLTDSLMHPARSSESGNPVHIDHTSHYTIHAIDGASVQGMLERHADTFTEHFHSQVRHLNK